MTPITLNKMEDILNIPIETQYVIINQEKVLYFLYKNNPILSDEKENRINIKEVRKKYINKISRLYENKDTEKDIIFSLEEIKKIVLNV